MQIVKPDQVGLLFTSCRLLEDLYLSIAAMACFSLDQGASQTLLTESVMWQTAAEALGDQQPLDLGFPKKRGEFLVYGAARSREPVQALEVEVSVGGMVKKLNVAGDRAWTMSGTPGTPKPFTEMPITWARAFGGPSHPANPVGIGLEPGQDGNIPLPNIQDPKHLFTSRREMPEPAGFAAFELLWPQRAKFLGAFDEQWLKTRWPDYPQGTDLEFFNTAPFDQRLSEFFQGDESIGVTHMNPDRPGIVSQLPGLRPRIFLNRQEGDQIVFQEAKARPETLFLFPNQNVGVLLFRAAAQVADEELDDVLHLMAEWEPLSQAPEPIGFYQERLEAILNPPLEVQEEPETPPPPEETAPPADEPPPAEPPPPPPAPAPPAVLGEAAALVAQARAQLAEVFQQLGVTEEEAVARAFPEPEPPPALSPDMIKDTLAKAEAQIEAVTKELGLTREEALARALPPEAPPPDPRALAQQTGALFKELDAQFQSMGVAPAEALAKAFPGLSWDELNFGKIAAELGALADVMDQAGEEPPAALPEAEEPAPEPPPEAEALEQITVARVMERYQKGESLSGLDLEGLDFSGQMLKGADFGKSILAKARFVEADLNGANFSEAFLADADFSRARMNGASMARVQAVGAIFVDADLAEALFSGSDFTKADFTKADLSRAVLSGAGFIQACFRNAKGQELQAEGASLIQADLTEADFRQADLNRSNLAGAILDRFQAQGVKAMGIGLAGASGTGGDFSGADLKHAQGGKDTVFVQFDFSKADLTRAAWDGARLTETRFTQARMEQADFSRAVFEKSDLVNVYAREANFMKAVWTDCDARGIDLFKAMLRKISVRGSNLSQTHFFGADLFGASIVDSKTDGAEFARVLLSKKHG